MFTGMYKGKFAFVNVASLQYLGSTIIPIYDKRSMLRRHCSDTNRNMQMLIYGRYGK